MRNVVVIFSLIFFGNSFAQKPSESLTSQYKSQITSANLIQESDDFIVTDAYQSSVSGVTHIYFSQRLNGLEVLGTESSIHMSRTGEIVFSSERFMRVSSEENIPSEVPIKSAIKGVEAALFALDYPPNGRFNETVNLDEPHFYLESEDYNFSSIKTALKYFRNKNNSLNLCWVYLMQDLATDQSWTVFVDAFDGSVLKTADWTQECSIGEVGYHDKATVPERPLSKKEEVDTELLNCTNCYEVFPYPYESPYDGFRQIVISPEHPIASPHGWHGRYNQQGTTDMTTTGNNVWAFDANDNYGYQPDGGEDLDFTGYTWSANYSNANQYEDASLTNMFYWINIAHDVLYQYGFNEAAGNFQFENFSNLGVEQDPIVAKAQTSLSCNAYFGVGPDGTRTVMSTNICGNRDANFDNTVLLHEYGHGIYGRLTGGPASTYCLYNAERTTEGVADWYAIMLTMKAEDPEELERHIARYFFNRGAMGDGIRTYPYSTDMTVNPQTYDDIKGAAIPHGVGQVWGAILWEVTWELINAHGFSSDIYNFTGDYNQDAGNVMALALITEGLKLQPCTPGFVTARDAILVADELLYDGQNECALWTAFAKRGLGINASQRDEDKIGDGIQSFETPSPYASFIRSFNYCYDDEVFNFLGGGTPNGGIYSGPGISDNGDGVSFTLDLIEAGSGIHTITYTIEDGDCQVASSADSSLEIIEDIVAPQIFCAENITLQVNQSDGLHSLNDYTYYLVIHDDCDDYPNVSQNPIVGTLLELGEHEITFEVTDRFGNVGSCSFTLKLVEFVEENEEAGVLNLYPNPVSETLILDNPNLILIDEIRIFDINGRLISVNFYEEKLDEIRINTNIMEAGLYFVFIKTQSNQIVKRLLKF